jgi:hypothetical protein
MERKMVRLPVICLRPTPAPRWCGASCSARSSYFWAIILRRSGPNVGPRFPIKAYCDVGLTTNFTIISIWCGRWDSNPHGLLRGILSPLRIPVPPRPRRQSFQARRISRQAARQLSLDRWRGEPVATPEPTPRTVMPRAPGRSCAADRRAAPMKRSFNLSR